MKKVLALAALAALAVATPALAQRHGAGGGHGGGGGHSGFHGGGHVGGGWHGGGGYRGGFGGYRGYRYGGPSLYFGFGAPAYYPPYYGPMYSPYYYGYPYPPAYRSYGYSEDLGDDDDHGERDWRVTRKENETDYELPDSVLFGLDSATISPDADAVLKEIADAAKEQPRARLVIEGHTDTSGTTEHNRQLSDARARAVAAVLARAGVERERITTEGVGESRLAVQTGDDVREPRNRRVVVRLIGESRAQAADVPRTQAPRGGNRP